MHSAQPANPADATIRAIAQAGNPVTQGWMPLAEMAAAFGAHGDAGAWLEGLARSPESLFALQRRYAEEQARLWRSVLAREPEPEPARADRRFAAREWRENPYYDYLRRSWLLAARFAEELADCVQVQGKAGGRLRFALRQWVDALCPANFAALNPEVLRAALATRGESLARGLANLIADARRGRMRQSDESAFEVGRNLALTPGDVVYENELMQLLQYRATTAEVSARPLLIVPPCINKYYILDLQPENSFVRHAVDAGHTVFMVSWRNVGPAQGCYGWDDYLALGIFEPLGVARDICRAERVNVLGFCVGGTLLGAALAVMAARGEDTVGAVTWLTTMLDFSEPGELGLFIDEPSVRQREATIGRGGILAGAELAFVFSALRANDLVWPYVVNTYLKGTEPPAFDLLYWNADSTNLPGPMYCYYVRNTYLENRLREPGALVNCGVPVDLRRVDRPSFILATREDHIVPWPAAYRSLHLLGGEKRFVLGASGHVAGVVNPAAKNRRSYWVGAGNDPPREPQAWLAQAEERRGSWWTEWTAWLEAHRGGLRRAPRGTGSKRYRPIEPAPGRYVKEKANPQGG